MRLQKVPAIVMVDEHLIVGEVQTRGKRLLEELCDPIEDWLHVYDVRVSRRDAKAKYIESLPSLVIRKSQVILALLDGGIHESPDVRRFAFVDKKLHPAFVTAAGYDVRGRLHLKGKREPLLVLEEMGGFVPFTEAVVSHAGIAAEKLNAAVAIVNKSAISMLHIGERLSSVAPSPF
jgi:hypothetical protein